jgi:hypothetical protein
MEDIKESTTSKKGGTNGSIAGVTPSDLDRGYTDAGVEDYKYDGDNSPTFEQQQGGFARRPGGWER